MVWIVCYLLGLFYALRARKLEKGVIGEELDPHKKLIFIGLCYFQAIVLTALPTYFTIKYTDNFLIYGGPTLVGAWSVLFACFFDYLQNYAKSNELLRFGFIAVLLANLLVMFAIPPTDYNFPQIDQSTNQSQQ